MVALMGTRRYEGEETTSSRVQAVCDWFGPSELLTMPPNNVSEKRSEQDVANSNGAKLLGATVKDVPKLARDASALDHVSRDDAAFLIMHGDYSGARFAIALASKEYEGWIAEYVKGLTEELSYGEARIGIKHDNAPELLWLRAEITARR